jgi:anion-transporting  ArsA/GET3 family ATPase
MASLLERKLIVVTGKGGTGKTTVACALGLLAAQNGLRTIVVELGNQHRLPALFGDIEAPESGVEIELEPDLWSISIDPDKALLEWMRTLAGRLSARMLAASSTFRYFAAAAPGAKELVSMIKVRRLAEAGRSDNEARAYDLVVLDAPATGHALGMLRSPQTFTAIVRVGPLAEQAQGVRDLLGDPLRSAYVAVAQGTEMAVTETLELEEELRRHLDRDLNAVIVNGSVPRRFTREELKRISAITDGGPRPEGSSGHDSFETTQENTKSVGSPRRITQESTRSVASAKQIAQENARLMASAGRMAHAVYERARMQQSQIARLRRQRFAEGKPPSVVTIPFIFTPELDLAAVRKIAADLERKL